MKVKNVFAQSVTISGLLPFYEAVLGLSPQFVDGERWAQFKVDGVTVALAAGEEALGNGQVGWVLTIEVPQLDAAVSAATHSGGQLLEQRDMADHGRLALVRDPSGNVTALWSAT